MDLTTKDWQDFYLFEGLGKNSRLGAMGIFDLDGVIFPLRPPPLFFRPFIDPAVLTRVAEGARGASRSSTEIGGRDDLPARERG